MRRFEYGVDLLVMSRKQAEDFYAVETNGEVPCISVTDPGAPEADLRYCEDALRLQFHDVERDDVAGMSHGLRPMTPQQAERVARFADAAKGPLVVHCEAGASRSAGIAAGLLVLNPESDEAGLYRETCPNATCQVRVMRAALRLEHAKKAIAKRNRKGVEGHAVGR